MSDLHPVYAVYLPQMLRRGNAIWRLKKAIWLFITALTP
jgi:hypothetical protein